MQRVLFLFAIVVFFTPASRAQDEAVNQLLDGFHAAAANSDLRETNLDVPKRFSVLL